MSRAAVVFPGRGAYGPGTLGSLRGRHAWVRRADELRAELGLEPLAGIDAAERFEPERHLRPSNAWPLIMLAGLLDAERIADDHEVVAVTASTTGWYTALVASGALGFDDAIRLVHALAMAAEAPLADGASPAEIIYPLTDEGWRPVDERIDRLAEALAATDSAVHVAIDLGGFAVLAGAAPAVAALAGTLPPVTIGRRSYPVRLAAPDGWHTPMRAEAIATAAATLPTMAWERPNVTLVDGRGARFTPWSTDPSELADQSIRRQGTVTSDLAASMRVVLREFAPDVVLLAGPGRSLGGACAQVVVMEGYRGLRTRATFEAAQGGPNPVLLALRR